MILLYCKSSNLLRLYTKNIYGDIYNEDLFETFCNEKENSRKDCLSECMTPTRAIEWWANPACLKVCNDETLAIRPSAIGFLLKNGNQSGVERTFSRYKRYASPARNQLDAQTTFNECLIAATKKKQCSI